ncbi:MAG: ImmA/IrrE family metallo-endopeptidase [Leptospirales bacterium]
MKNNFEWLKKFPIKNLQEMGYLPPGKDRLELLEGLLHFFRVPGVDQWASYYSKTATSFRKSPSFTDDLPHIATWLRVGEKIAEQVETHPYNKEKFSANLKKIRDLTNKSPKEFEPEMKKLCAEAGVALVFVPEFQKTHVSGATRWLSSDKAMIVMSLRHKTNDHFWFTFFHEAAHILKHGRKEIFIDSKELDKSDKEEEANRFSRNMLIPEKEYNRFVKAAHFYEKDILEFAKKNTIHPAIVVGRLQREDHIDHGWHNGFKEKFELKGI